MKRQSFGRNIAFALVGTVALMLVVLQPYTRLAGRDSVTSGAPSQPDAGLAPAPCPVGSAQSTCGDQLTPEELVNIEFMVINAPSEPPAGIERPLAESSGPIFDETEGSRQLEVPTSTWTYGSAPTATGMLFAYYDRNGYPDLYTGPSNGGVCPLSDVGQGIGTPIEGATSIIATQNGFDGQTTDGHVDDYWFSAGSAGLDPWEVDGVHHNWDGCTADYLGSNQWRWILGAGGIVDSNNDGDTILYTNGANKLYNFVPPSSFGLPQTEVSHGMRLFAESRDYSVVDNYTQGVDTQYAGGFSFAEFQAEIDGGNPVLLHLAGDTNTLTVVGVGYKSDGTVLLNDTWDNFVHTMTWGGSYAGYTQLAVTVIHLDPAQAGTSQASGKGNKAIATVVSVTSSRSNGSYDAGEVIPIQVTFDQPVNYVAGTGVAQLQMETGATDRQAPYVSGSGTATLTFNYTVLAGDTSLDLEYLNTSALTLTGTATIRDLSGVDDALLTLPALATINSLGGSKAIVIDTTAPTVVSVTSTLTNGTYAEGQVIPIRVTFSSGVTYTPGTGGAQLQLETGATDQLALYSSGTSNTMILNYTVVAGDVSPDLEYLSTAAFTLTGTATLRDGAGNNAILTLPALATANSLGGSKALVINAAVPSVVSVTSTRGNGSYTAGAMIPIQVVFNKPVVYLPGTGLAQLELETGATDRQAPYASGSGTTTLTFNYTIVAGDTSPDLQYLNTSALTLTGTASIKDTGGIDAVLALPELDSVSSLGGIKAIVIDTTPPTVLSVSSTKVNGAYTVGQVIPITVKFSSSIAYTPGTGLARIQLETGATDRIVNYTSSGSGTMTFSYTIQAGDSSADLEYLSTAALTLTGTAKIKDGAGNAAILTLPALGSANSLGGSKALVVNTSAPTVVSVTSSKLNGTYTVGQSVPVQVTFNKPVTYIAGTGLGQLQLETGTTDRFANYTSGSATTALTFTYAIVAGDSSADLEYLSTAALALSGSATIRDASGLDANLTLPALATANSLGGSKALVIDTSAPTVVSVTSSLADATYSTGQVVPIQVTFSKVVTYTKGTGLARIQLETGTTDRFANYASGTNTATLTFNYVVVSGDSSPDLDYLNTAALTFTGTASIKDLGGIGAVLTLPALASPSSLSGSKAIVIDTTAAPTVLSVTSSLANGSYTVGQVVPVQVTFNQTVIYAAGTGVAQLQLETGTTDQFAPYASGSGTTALTFNYTVTAGNTSADLQYLNTSALTLTGTATIRNGGGTNAIRTLPLLTSANSLGGSKAIVIDTTAPTVLNVTSTLANGTYNVGQVIPVRVTFSEAVTYTAGSGVAQLQLETGTTDQQAPYASGSGTTALIFNYTVTAGDASLDLEYLSTAALTLTGTASLRDATTNNATLTLPALATANSLGGSKAIVINTTPSPTVVSVTSSLDDGLYTVGQVVPIEVTFSQVVNYLPGTGVARIQLETGATDRQANYASGTGTAVLTFDYTVVATDTSADLEYLSTAALTLTGSASIKNTSGTNATLALPALATANSLGGSKAIVIDTTGPTVLNVTSSLANGSYTVGQVVPIQVTFNGVVNYLPGTGLAQLQLETGTTDQFAPYVGGTGTAVLTFNYTVLAGDTSADLQYKSTAALTLTGTASIRDAATNNATLTLPALATANSLGGSKAIVINTAAPTVSSVTSTLANGSYSVGQVVPIRVTFSKPVNYTAGSGVAQLQLETGTTDRQAPYASGSGTTVLTFNYTVVAGDASSDLQYLSTTALTLTGTASINDLGGVASVLTLPGLASASSLGGSKAIVINTTPPVVSSVTSSAANGTYSVGQVVPIQVTFNKAVTYTPGSGVAQLQLETGTTDRQAPYASGSGTAVLTFNYTVVAGDTSADLQYLSTTALTLTGSATIQESGVSAVLTLPGLASVSSLGGSKAIVVNTTTPTVTNVTSTLVNGTYTVGQVVPVRVTFSKPVVYTPGSGVARVQLETGTTDQYAVYASGSGTTQLIFNYTIAVGDASADLEYLSTAALTLTVDATIRDTGTLNAVLTLPALATASSLGGSKAIVIDTAVPTVVDVTSTKGNSSFSVGTLIPIQVVFNKAVTYVPGSGSAQLQLETGTTDQFAPYTSGSGTATLTFTYTVAAGDTSADLQYLSTGALTLSGDATIKDVGGLDAVLTLPALASLDSLAGNKAIVIDTTSPTVLSVTSSLANGSYTIGQVVPIQVTFSQLVNYNPGTGAVQLQLETGTTDRIATYLSGGNGTVITFSYTVVAGDTSADLEYLSTAALTLTGTATIRDAALNNAVLTLPTLGSANSLGGSKAIVINTASPAVVSVTSSLADGIYTVGQVVPVQVTFNKAVNYVAGTGLAELQLETGATDRLAPYASGSGTTVLTFNYTVMASDASADLEYLSTAALTLSGDATIKDTSGIDADLALPALASANSLGGSKAIVIDTTPPTVSSVTSSLADGTYGVGQVVPIQVTFNKAVTYTAGTGVAQLQVESGATDQFAPYASGSGTTTLSFNYTVVATDTSADLEYLSTGALTLTGTASIRDSGSVNATLTLPALATANSLGGSKAIVIDTTAPTVLNVTSSLTNGIYTVGQVVPIQVTFNEAITYTAGTGVAQLQLETGATDRQAAYGSGSGTAVLTFNYTVVAADASADLEYLSTAALTVTGTATLRDVANNNATLTLPALATANSLGGSKAIVIDTVASTVSGVTSNLANGSYTVGQVVPIQVTFSEAVIYTPGTGLAQLQLETGTTDRQAPYASGSGTPVLTFNYTVVAGDTSADLQYLATTALTLSGTATIRDAAGNNATLTLPALASGTSLGGSKAIIIDSTAPTIPTVTSSLANGTYAVGQVVPIQVTFSEAVTYVPGTGIAQLQLETGTTDRQATYASGSGTSVLTFNYTVVAGDASTDLQYLSTAALTLTGTATLRDAAANNATLTLPALGSASSLGGSKAIVIATVPVVLSVTSSLPDGAYTVGQVIPIQVTFSQVVNYLPGTGLAQLQLETGVTDRQATYATGSGSATLTFSYTVVAGDVTADLQYVATNSLALTGTATIRNASAINALLTLPGLATANSLGGSKDIVIP